MRNHLQAGAKHTQPPIPHAVAAVMCSRWSRAAHDARDAELAELYRALAQAHVDRHLAQRRSLS